MNERDIPTIGSVFKGRVVRFQDDAVVVNLGNGLIGHLRNPHISWLDSRAAVDQHFTIGQDIDVIVIKANRSKTSGFVHVTLGHKQTQPNPWDNVDAIISVGARVRGRVARDLLFGALVELPGGFLALVHVSELSWTARKPKVENFMCVGNVVEVVVTSVDKVGHKIQASYRQAQPNPWIELPALYPVGSTVRAIVATRVSYGLFVKLPNGCQGLVHNSSIPPNYPAVVIGDPISVQILDIDSVDQRLNLTIQGG